ncbi:MAG TPA: SseB family protein [Rhodanobacteraceae bacterium]|nr:SseB family protein [Rhodanobacteraceae bacterium]
MEVVPALVTEGKGASAIGLDRLIEAAAKDPSREPELFQTLLDATMYAHTLIDDKSERLRLVMFKSPDDGSYVVPVFTDKAKAEFAARGNVRLVEGTGREMLEIIRGTAVMINPNDVRCTLYPEEIGELLASGTIAPIQKAHFEDGQTQCFKLGKVPPALVKAMKRSLPKIHSVEMAYVAGLKWRTSDRPDSLMIVLGGRADREDREARAAAVALHRVTEQLGLPVDIVHFDSSQAKPEWIRRLKLVPVYRRRPGQPISVSKYN